LLKNNTDIVQRNFIIGITPTAMSLQLHKKLSLQESDYLVIQVSVSGGAKTVDITASDAYTNFSGNLITPTSTSIGPWN
jgi:hypothetical protein